MSNNASEITIVTTPLLIVMHAVRVRLPLEKNTRAAPIEKLRSERMQERRRSQIVI